MRKLKLDQQSSINYYLNKNNAVLTDYGYCKIIEYNTEIRGNVYPAMACFIGKSAKVTNNYYYHSTEKRQEKINNILTNLKRWDDQKKDRRNERKEFRTTCKPGDVFECNWGYEQTNVDYYVLIELKGNVGTFREIGYKVVEGSLYSHGMACEVVPDITKFVGDRFKKRILLGETISLASYKYCHKSDCKSTYMSWYA